MNMFIVFNLFVYLLFSFKVNSLLNKKYNPFITHHLNKLKVQYKNIIKINSKSNKDCFTSINLYEPKTINQQLYTNYLEDNNSQIIIINGPAGSGKTLFACQYGITNLLNENIKKIIVTRPTAISIENDIGTLPGNLIDKMTPWTKPMFDIFLEYVSKSELKYLIQIDKIEICPLVFMRGRTFKNTFIIADEMQNSTPLQMKTLLTRLGENSKIVITGDLEQTDIHVENGLNDFLNKIKNYDSKFIKIIHFNSTDICRSLVVQEILDIYNVDRY